jgi:mannose PTS system EIIA component
MLIRLAGARKAMDVTAAVAAVAAAGRNYITVASELLGQSAAPAAAKA